MLKTAAHTDRPVAEQSSALIKQAGIVICASAVIAVCSRLILPLPFTPVPLTLGNFAVLLVGLAIGSRRGSAAAALYLVWGAMGLPVFNPVGPGGVAQLLGPTGGYLWAYPVMAFLAGWIVERGASSFARNVLAGAIGELALFAGGLSWLAIMTHSWQRAAYFGLYPFFFAEVMKVMAAAAIALRLRRSTALRFV
jgi:biotin transport system substrate-specific component